MPFAGLTIVSCEHGVMRQSPEGLYLYTDDGREEISIPPHQGRAAELIELRDALAEDRGVFPNGEWGKATLEICLADSLSARETVTSYCTIRCCRLHPLAGSSIAPFRDDRIPGLSGSGSARGEALHGRTQGFAIALRNRPRRAQRNLAW